MARRKITTIEEQEPEAEPINAAPVEIEQEPESGPELTVSDRIAAIKARGELDECVSRIYANNGTRGREYVGKVNDVAEEDYLAENYGPGKYIVLYDYRANGVHRQTTQNFTISEAYRAAKRPEAVQVPAPANNGLLAGLLGGMTAAEKVTAAVALIEGVKKIFAPPPPPVDLTELLKVIAANRAPALGDAVIMKAMEMNRPAPPPAPSILTQIKELNEVKELLSESEGNTRGGDSMDFIIKTGLQMLPALLKQNGGSYAAAGAAVKDNAMISGLLQNDPDLLGEFCAAVKEKYGEQAAQELARGYGFELEAAAPEQPAAITNDAGTTAPNIGA